MTGEKPRVRLHLTDKRTIRMKLPVKNARWHGSYKTLDEAVKAAFAAGIEAPFIIDYVIQED